MNLMKRLLLSFMVSFIGLGILLSVTAKEIIASVPDSIYVEPSFAESSNELSSSGKRKNRKRNRNRRLKLIKSFTKEIKYKKKRYKLSYYDTHKEWMTDDPSQFKIIDSVVEFDDDIDTLLNGSPSSNIGAIQSNAGNDDMRAVSPNSLKANSLQLDFPDAISSLLVVSDISESGDEQVIAINAFKSTQQEEGEERTVYGAPPELTDQSNATLTHIKINDIIPVEGDMISATPEITLSVQDADGISTVNVTARNVSTLQNEDTVTSLFSSETSEVSATASFTTALSNGNYIFMISALDINGNETQAQTPTVSISDSLTLAEFISGPNPFNPNNEECTLQYQLSVAADVSLHIYSISGELQYSSSFGADSNGGKAGLNSVTWNGVNRFNEIVANGPYIAYLSAEANGIRQHKKHKILVLK